MYFKKEKDIILNGTLWKEVESKFMCVHHLQITKNTPANPGRAPGWQAGRWVRFRVPYGFLPVLMAWPDPTLPSPTGVPPSGLFIVESVFICFIMKNKFAKVY